MEKHHPVIRTVAMWSLEPGDTVVLDGEWKTTDRRAIKRCQFMGTSLWGDTRALQGRMVDVVLFPKWRNGAYVGHVRQP